MDRSLIDRYAAGADLPARAIAGLSRDDMVAFPVPGTWSIHQIIIHLMDSDLIASDRMKRIIAEDRPLILAYNESLFTARLSYHDTNADDACRIFALNRRLTADLLRRLPDETFKRVGIHTERGTWSLAEVVQSYGNHLHDHLSHLYRKRALLGKPLAGAPLA